MTVRSIRTLAAAVLGLSLASPVLAAETPAREPTKAERPATSVAEPAPVSPADAKLPADVVGSWSYGSVSPTTVHDVYTGKYLGSARSMGSFFEFAADGSFKQYTLISVNNHGWALMTWTEAYGTASFDPARGVVTLAVTNGKYKVTDNRVTKNNYDRDMTEAETRKHSSTRTFKVAKGDDGKPRLEVGNGDGKTVTAYKPWERATAEKGK